jgi:hypothetical protein
MTTPTLSARVDPDGVRSHALANLVEHLTGPLAAGAVTEEWQLDSVGSAQLDWARKPLLLLRVDMDLDLGALEVAVSVAGIAAGPPPAPGNPAAAGGVAGRLTFAPFTERGACLPVYPLAGQPVLPDAWIRVAAIRMAADGSATAVPAGDLTGLLTVVLVQGDLGRLAYLLGAEKPAIRRAAREVTSARLLALARSGSLDRHGADLGVPRFTDRLVTEPGPPPQLSTAPRTEPDSREPDPDYRRRLAVFRQLAVPTRAGALEALNGPGNPAGLPTGWLAALGGTRRIDLAEETNPFAVGMMLVSTAGADVRPALLADLRRDRLVRPVLSPDATAAYASRLLTDAQRADLDQLSQALRDGYTFTAQASSDPALAPGLARALSLVARCRTELGAAGTLSLRHAQDGAGGSRYELGFGADLGRVSAAAAEQLRTAALAWTPGPGTPPDLAGVLHAAAARAAAGPDPLLGWLFEACGLRTVQAITTATLYVSQLPIAGLDVSGIAAQPAGGWSHIVPLSQPFAVLRYARSAGTAELVRAPGDGAADTVIASQAGLPAFDQMLLVPGRNPRTTDLVLGYRRAAGAGDFYSVTGAGLLLIREHADWRKSWSLIAPGRFGGSTSAGDLVFFERSTGTFELYSVTDDAQILPVQGQATLTSGGWGSWTDLVACPGLNDDGTDGLLCYDSGSGDVQLLVPDTAAGFRVAWHRAGWRPGLTHVRPGPAGPDVHIAPQAGEPQLLGHDREDGTLTTWGGLRDGTLAPTGTFRVGQRALTHLTVQVPRPGLVLAKGAQAPRLVTYDRASGLSGLIPLPLPDQMAVQRGQPTPGQPAPGQLAPPAVRWSDPSPMTFTATFSAVPGDQSQPHVVLTDSISAAATAWAADGQPAWTVITDAAAQQAIWAQIAGPGPFAPALAAAGLPVAGSSFPEAAGSLPGQYLATLQLNDAQVARWRAGQDTDQVSVLAEVLSVGGLASAAALPTTTGALAIVVAITGLPGVGLTLADRRTAGYRWYALPVRGLPGRATATGAVTRYLPADDGLTLLVVLGYRRSGQADPYEVRVTPAPDGVLTPDQYEFLLNVVERAVPAGVEINSYALRRQHVDISGDGIADPLTPPLARTYRRFRTRNGRDPHVGTTSRKANP